MTDTEDELIDRIHQGIKAVRSSGQVPNALILHEQALRLKGSPFFIRSTRRRRELFGRAKHRMRSARLRRDHFRRLQRDATDD